MKEHDLLPDVLHTSMLSRAIQTANFALDTANRSWIPVKRSWRLNERHYGALQGKDKAQTLAEYGEEQFQLWRRSFDVPPPPIDPTDTWAQQGDPRYADIEAFVPRTESLKIVIDRMLPYWSSDIATDVAVGKVTLVVAHGNSLRALVDRDLRAKVIAANAASDTARIARVTGKGHAFWADAGSGVTRPAMTSHSGVIDCGAMAS